MTNDEIIAVVQAHKDGAKIQCRIKRGMAGGYDPTWGDDPKPIWNFSEYDYRVKLVEGWFNQYPDYLSGPYESRDVAKKNALLGVKEPIFIRECSPTDPTHSPS